MMKRRIFYHDTDCGGVVYYANYLKFMEEARTLFFEERGIDLQKLHEQEGVLFVVARQEADYKAPGRYGDLLEIGSVVVEFSSVRLNFDHEIFNQNGNLLVKAKAVVVCVGRDFRPQAIPDQMKRALSP